MLTVAAQADNFDGGAGVGDPSWSNALNWASDTVPTGTTPVQAINVPGYGVVVNNPGAMASEIHVGTWGWIGSIDVQDSGTLSTVGNMLIAAQDAASVGTVVNDGQINVAGIAYLHAGVGVLENNGTFGSTHLHLGHIAGSDTTLINTGDITTGILSLSVAGNSVFNMNGGTVTVGTFNMVDGGTGRLNLYGGTTTTTVLALNDNGDYTIDIREGVLVAGGNHTATMALMESAGLITAYGGDGTVISEYDAGTDMTTLSAEGCLVVEKTGEFIIEETGEQFFPVGFNYIDLRTNDLGWLFHDTFNPNHYNTATVASNLAEIAAAKFNTLRVFIETGPSTNSVVMASSDTTLSVAYMQRVADFLEQSHAHGLHVIITFESFPSSAAYISYKDEVVNVEGANRFYLNPGYIAAKRLYMRDFIQMLGQLAPDRLADTVLAFDPQNEVTHYVEVAPFSLLSGTVTPANGATYDLATDKVQLADEMAVYWMDQMAEEIHQQAPGVLADVNMFTYAAVQRSIGDFHSFGVGDWRNRYPFRPEALAASGADFLDLHFYTANSADLQSDLDSIEFDAVASAWKAAGKPMIVGEFGAFTNVLSLAGAVSWKEDEVDLFASHGFLGWLYWTYNTDVQGSLWNAKSGGGVLFDVLEARAKENYFGYPPAADDLDGDGMPDRWEIQYFGSINAVNGGANEDYEGDKMANRAEYLAGTIPDDPASKFMIVDMQSDVGGLEVQWSSAPCKSYQMLRSGSLVEPKWSTFGDPVHGTGAVSVLTVPVDADQGFYKVRLDR